MDNKELDTFQNHDKSLPNQMNLSYTSSKIDFQIRPNAYK